MENLFEYYIYLKNKVCLFAKRLNKGLELKMYQVIKSELVQSENDDLTIDFHHKILI